MTAARFVHFAAICLLFGLAAFPFYAIGREEEAPRFRSAVLGCATVALVSGGAVLLAMAGNMGDSWLSAFDPQVLGAAVTDTAFGRVWVGRLILCCIVLPLAASSGSSRSAWMLIGSALLLGSVSLTGHSALPGGALGALHQVADAAHLLAAGWWVGGLLALVMVAPKLGDRTPAVLGRFSGVGYAAVAVILVTGLFKSVILVGSVAAVVGSAYGWVLLVKVGLFAGMGLLALSNRFQITPALQRGDDRGRWLKRLRVQVAAEFGLGVAVLAVVGALGAMAPPIAQ